MAVGPGCQGAGVRLQMLDALSGSPGDSLCVRILTSGVLLHVPARSLFCPRGSLRPEHLLPTSVNALSLWTPFSLIQ